MAGAVDASSGDRASRRAWQTLFITSVSLFLVSMDVTIVSVALPEISDTFSGTSDATLSWVFTSYNVTFAALLLLAGKLGDRWGRKEAFLWGLALFLGASVVAGVAPTIAVLIVARTLQAVGSALIYPASLALLLPEFPPSRRSMAIGVWGGIAGLGAALGPTLGALLVEGAGWRAVFFINVPFVVAALAAGVVVLRTSHGDKANDPFDAIAVPAAALAVGFFVLGVVQGGEWGWTDIRVIGCFVIAAVLFPLFLYRSAHHPNPLLDLELFSLRTFSTGITAQSFYVGTFFGWVVLMPTFLIEVWGWSALQAGLALAIGPAIAGVLSPLAGRLADRVGHRELVIAGALVAAAGMLWWVLAIDEQPNFVGDMLPGAILVGVGATAGFATLTGAIMSDIPPRFYSMAGATRSTIFQLATAVGIAVAVALVGSPSSPSVAPFARTWTFGVVGSVATAVIMAVFYRRQPADRAAMVTR